LRQVELAVSLRPRDCPKLQGQPPRVRPRSRLPRPGASGPRLGRRRRCLPQGGGSRAGDPLGRLVRGGGREVGDPGRRGHSLTPQEGAAPRSVPLDGAWRAHMPQAPCAQTSRRAGGGPRGASRQLMRSHVVRRAFAGMGDMALEATRQGGERDCESTRGRVPRVRGCLGSAAGSRRAGLVQGAIRGGRAGPGLVRGPAVRQPSNGYSRRYRRSGCVVPRTP
jgi:hypothetical protein